MKRRRNPVYSSGKKFRYRVVDGQKVPPKNVNLTKRDRKQFSKTVAYMDRVKELRPFFGELFDASNGYDLRNIDQWTPHQKAKVTRYYRVMAPRLKGGAKVVKRYRRPDHLQAAIDESLQEERLPGQTAAVFSVDPGQELKITFNRKHQPTVTRAGISEQKLRFNKKSFLEDWKTEIERVLDETDAQIFKIITGANQSNRTFTRGQVMQQVLRLMESYPIELEHSEQFDDRPYDEWLNGLVAYEGVTMRHMQAKDRVHKKTVEERRRAHLKALAKVKYTMRPKGKTSDMKKGRKGRIR